jgi:hypothetical protein
MSTDLETDLRREFEAARAPGSLTFSPDSVARTGRRTIRRRQIIAAGSTTMAIALIAGGVALLTTPDNSAAPPPANRTATTGIVLARTGHMWGGQSEVRFNRDPTVQSNMRYSIVGKDGRRHELGVSSTGTPDQKPTASWKSGMVDGHPVTFGVYPGRTSDPLTIVFANGISYPVGSEELRGTGYMMFYVDYSAWVSQKEPARPSKIASIRWSGPSGVVDGIESDHGLTGRVFTVGKNLQVEVVLRPGDGGRTMVFGTTRFTDGRGSYGFDLSSATTDPTGVAVVTSRQPITERVLVDGRKVMSGTDGPPLAAGVLPPGASDIGAILTTNVVANGLPVSESLPDGRVIFAFQTEATQPSNPNRDSIKAVTWTNANGTRGRIAVTQKQR